MSETNDIFDKIENFFLKNNYEKRRKIFYGTIFIIYVFMFVTAYNLIKCENCLGFIIAAILQYIFAFFTLTLFIQTNINNKEKSIPYFMYALVINILFALIPITLFNSLTLIKFPIQVIYSILVFVLLYFINKFIHVNNEDDTSYLKASNYFLVAVITIVVFFIDRNKTEQNKVIFEKLEMFFNIYYLFPLLMLQGLYELIDRKKKLVSNKQEDSRK